MKANLKELLEEFGQNLKLDCDLKKKIGKEIKNIGAWVDQRSPHPSRLDRDKNCNLWRRSRFCASKTDEIFNKGATQEQEGHWYST